MQNFKHKIMNAMLAMLGLIALHSCFVFVELHPEEYVYRGQLKVEFDWSKSEPFEIPDSMIVWGLRPVFRDKMSSVWASLPNPGEREVYGHIVAPNTEQYAHRYSNHTNRDSILLPPGEWHISSFTATGVTKEAIKGFTYDIADNGSLLTFRKDTFNTLPERYYYWYERNDYNNWTFVDVGTALFMGRDTIVVSDVATPDSVYTAQLCPELLTQKIIFTFDAELVDDDIQVDSIVCCVSGIITNINLQTMDLDVYETHRGIFHTDLSHTDDGCIRARGHVYVPGLVRSSTSTMLKGPGLLEVCVFVSYDDEDGSRKYRRLDGLTNLYHPLTETPSILKVESGEVVQTDRIIEIYVKSKMQISKSRLSSSHDAITPWEDATEIEIELN